MIPLLRRPNHINPVKLARRIGRSDAKAGRYLGQNPFDRHAEAARWMAWRAGWKEAKRGRVGA